METTIYQEVFQTSIYMVAQDTEVNMLKDTEKTRHTFTKNMLVKDIAEETEQEIKVVRTFYEKLEEAVFDALSSADENTDVSVRLFEGMVLNSEFVPSKKKVNNLTGETITTVSKIKPSAHITRYYRDKLTAN